MLKNFAFGRRRTGAALRIVSALVAAAALSGCYTTAKETPVYPNDYRKRHQIGLRDGQRTVEVFIGQSRGSLTPTQRAEVSAFAQVWREEATGGVIIDMPTNTPNQVAASQAVREINSIFAASGVPMQSVAVRPYTPEDPAKFPTVRLKYSKIVAEAGPCGLWPHDLGPSWGPTYAENVNYWNLGCSVQRNLAAMVANPADLVQPRGEGEVWTPRRTTVFEKYRVGQGSATVYPNPNKGYLSDIGQ